MLARLQRWYEEQCDGDWEHTYGVEIETLDNPGWQFKVDLRGTALLGRDFLRVEDQRAERDWVVCWVEDEQFRGACGPRNLDEALTVFLDFAASAQD